MKQLCLCSMLALWMVAYGQVYDAGTTYMDIQHAGSCGRMTGVDNDGFVHMVWMNRQSGMSRGIYYQLWNPLTQQMEFLTDGQPTGVQVSAVRAGYATLALRADGFCFPAFHQAYEEAHVATAIDFQPRFGAFTSCLVPVLWENGSPVATGWPMTSFGQGDVIHLLCGEVALDPPQRLFYSRGIAEFVDGEGVNIEYDTLAGGTAFECFDSTVTLGYDIVASATSDRVARAWIRPVIAPWMDNFYNRDIFCQVSEDGGFNWGPVHNLTQFIQPDTACHNSTGNDRCCDRDTLRAFNDMSLMFDELEELHVAFTAIGHYQWLYGLSGPFVRPLKAMIWHWSEASDSFSAVAEYWIPDSLLTDMQQLKTSHAMVERPSLSRGTDPGTLYCAYQQYDTACYSSSGYMNADVFVSVSSDFGLSWSQGTNVTQSCGATVPTPPGENRNEQDISAADHEQAGHLDMFYLLDRGTADIGVIENPMQLHRVDVADIPGTPLMPFRPFHVAVTDCDSVQTAGRPVPAATEFRLDPAYPNPFNSTTLLRFDLPRSSHTQLIIYDLMGREVSVLQNGNLQAGSHVAVWNAENFASGVYFVSLRAGNSVQMQKLMLLK